VTRVGVVDVGTNSVRLLIAEGRDAREVERDLRITRLGEGVDTARALAPEATRRTVDAIEAYAGRARAAGCAVVRVVATSAVRDAANRQDFIAAVRAGTGLDAEVLSGAREAELGFRGATFGIGEPGPYLVVDVGGGSTEVVAGGDRVEGFASMDIGSVRLTERHILTDPPAPAEQAAARADARAVIDDARAGVGRIGGTMIGLAGTFTTLAAIALGLEAYDRDRVHHASLGRDAIAAIRARLATMTNAERRALPAMPRGREDVIVAGALIVEELMDAFARPRCIVSETDILDGCALESLGQAGSRVPM
jgi:exopolyphosphatase/guanosine-5'-triphosphate,3'-diphosphate pyrophosphatase